MHPTPMIIRGWLCLLLALLTTPPLAAQQDVLQGLDAYVEKGMQQWKVPGLAIAVVEDDSVVFAKGYGVRELGKADRVDAQTLFAIGSASKAFTAAAVGMLVDEEKVKWDEPATEYLPGFQLFDPYVTREMTVRDLLTHRSGLVRGDLLWYATDLDRDEILRRVRYLEPTWSFRSHFGYQNIMYLAGGEVVEEVSGQSWDDFVKNRIFQPLGMNASSTSILALEGQPNVASPHAELEDQVQPVAWRNIDNIAPAGSINSNVLDMAQWVRLQLGHGTYQGREVMSKATVEEMHAPQTIVPREPGWMLMAPNANFMTYGMGWFLNDFRGHKVVQHGGNIDGMSALVGMLPEENLGVVVLTNLNGNGLTHAVMYRIFDSYLGEEQTDWSTRALTVMDSLRGLGEAQLAQMEAARVSGTSPSLELDKYAGTYEHEMYGEFDVSLDGGKLQIRSDDNHVGELEHWHYDTFQITWRDPMMGKGFVSFEIDPMGKVANMDVQGLAEFARVPEEAETAASR